MGRWQGRRHRDEGCNKNRRKRGRKETSEQGKDGAGNGIREKVSS